MNVVRCLSKLAALYVGLLMLVATPAWADKEEVWLDSRSSTPVRSQMVLKRGTPYLVTMKGTYSTWSGRFAPGAKSGQPESAPMFTSPKGANKEVGFDPEFIFAWPKGSALERISEPSPRRNSSIEVSLDGGKTWSHPSSTATFNTTGHEYNYKLMGDNNALQVRLVDKPYTDNYGRVQIFVLPAEGSPSFLHAPNGDFSQAHPDTIINYITWDGTEWTAKFDGDRFVHAPKGDWSRSHVDVILNYITWDGSKWTVRLEQRRFLHAPQGDFTRAHPDDIINYKTWGGSPWTARLVW